MAFISRQLTIAPGHLNDGPWTYAVNISRDLSPLIQVLSDDSHPPCTPGSLRPLKEVLSETCGAPHTPGSPRPLRKAISETCCSVHTPGVLRPLMEAYLRAPALPVCLMASVLFYIFYSYRDIHVQKIKVKKSEFNS